MYFERFGLSRPPFEDTTNPAFFFASANAQTVLAELGAAIDGESGLLWVGGPAGVGKTILAQVFAKLAGEKAHVVMLAVPAACEGMIRAAAGPEGQSPATASMDRKVAQLLEAIEEHTAQRTVVVVDRAEHLAVEDLVALQRLIQAALKKSLHLCVVLFGAPQLEDVLRQPDAKRIARGMRRMTNLAAIPADELAGYIEVRLGAAGGTGKNPFSPEAITRLAEAAAGIPREVNALAKRAMMRAAGREAESIEVEDIDAAAEEAARIAPAEETTGESMMTEHRAAEESAGGPVEPVRAAVLASRLEQAMAAAPQQLRTLEIGISRLREEAHRLLTEAQGRLERAAEIKVEIGDETATLIRRHEEIEAAIEKAENQQKQLAEFARRMAQIGQTAEERLGLLMTSLETANGIHDKLQRVGTEVVGLAEEAQSAASGERERLQKLVDEIEENRSRIAEMLADARRQRDAVLDEHRQAIARQLGEVQTASSETTASVHAVLEQMRREMAEMQAAQLQQASAQRAELQAMVAAARDEARAELAAMQQAIVDTRQMVGTECAALQADGVEVQSKYRQVLDEARELQESIRKDMRVLQAQAQDHAKLVSNAGELQQRTQGMLTRAEETARTIERMLSECKQTSGALSMQTDEAVRRLEGLVQIEESARDTARESLVAARSALAQVNDAQQKLGEAQQAAIDVEAAAAATRASVRTEIKRAEENLRTVVSANIDKAQAVINGMVDDAARTARQTLGAVEQAAGSAARRIRDELTEAMEEARLEHEAARVRSMEASSDLLNTTNAQCDRLAVAMSSAETAQRQLSEAAQVAQRTATEVVEQARQQAMRIAEKAGAAVEATAERTQRALGETTQATLARLAGEVEEMTTTAQERVGAAVEEAVSGGMASITRGVEEQVRAGQARLVGISQATVKETIERVQATGADCENQISTVARDAEQRMKEVAQTAAETIAGELGAASDAARTLKEAVRTAETTIREVATCREQVDHAIRDVWSLTSTTEERRRQLEGVVSAAGTMETNLTTLLGLAEERAADLKIQASTAEQHLTALGEQHQRVRALMEDLTAKASAAGETQDKLQQAVTEGQRLAELIGREGVRLEEGLTAVQAVLNAIGAEDEKVKVVTAHLTELTGAAGVLDQRVSELQQGLAQPLSIIQNARAQAEELNDICLAVKRVFRSVTQASAEAGERMNVLGQLLTATERAAQTMKQWVEEANRARDRLETTLAQVPSIQQTHPSMTVPPLIVERVIPAPDGAAKPLIDPADGDLLKRLLQKSAFAGGASRAAMPEIANPGAAAVSAPASTTKQIEPLREALKARQAAGASAGGPEPVLVGAGASGGGAAAENGSAGPAGAKAAPRNASAESAAPSRVLKGSGPAGSGARLRPEDVRAMIEEARKRATNP